MNREIHGESNMWSTAQRWKRIYGFGVNIVFELKYRSVGYGKQCSLVWSCVDERGWSCIEKGIRF